MYITVKQLAEKVNNLERFTPEELKPETVNDYKQYIADTYHCSEIWGQKMTEEEMYISLVEWEKEKYPGDYSPSPYLFRQCCKYWNELCELYPS